MIGKKKNKNSIIFHFLILDFVCSSLGGSRCL